MSNQLAKKKGGLGAALSATLQSERKSVADRFNVADRFFDADQRPPASAPAPATATPPAPRPVNAAEPAPKAPATEQPPAPVRVIRDTFTFPPADYERIAAIQQSSLEAALHVNKSEVVRAGLIALQELPAERRHELVRSLERMKPGRPVT